MPTPLPPLEAPRTRELARQVRAEIEVTRRDLPFIKRQAIAWKERLKAFALRLPGVARLRRSPQSHPPGDAEACRAARLRMFLAYPEARLVFPRVEQPFVTILVLNYNRAAQLLECLESILAHTTEIRYELLVVDNASTDLAPALLRRVDNAQIILSQDNLGFVRGNNLGAAHARGRYLLLLNNDTIVTPGWLSTLVHTLENYPGCGAVGSKLLFPDGRLQEAGTICWNDGRVDQCGFNGDPLAVSYQHVREVDYCSAACVLLRTELFQRIGGFDERYIPCYYEDVDLGFAVRAQGLKVVYQPASVVFHHGPSPASVRKTVAQCEKNKAVFVAKWREQLAHHGPGNRPEDLIVARDRRPGPRVLLVGTADEARRLASRGCVVTLVCSRDSTPGVNPMKLGQDGIEVQEMADTAGLATIFAARRGCQDAVIISRDDELVLARRHLPLTALFLNVDAYLAAASLRRAS